MINRRKKEVAYTCPKCQGSNKLYWNSERKVGYCFKCGFRLSGSTQFRKLLRMDAPNTSSGQLYLSSKAPSRSEWVPAYSIHDGLLYLSGRGVSRDLATEIGIMWNGTEMCFPLTSFSKDALAWARRSPIRPGWMVGSIDKENYVFGPVRNIPQMNTLWLVEGVFDLLSPGLYHTGVSLLGSDLSPSFNRWLARWLSPTTPVILWLDNDETGRRKAPKLAHQLRWVPDLTILHGWEGDPRDPGDYRPPEVGKLLWEATRQGTPTPVKGGV